MSDIKDILHTKLAVARADLLAAVDGASEYDLRRPATPTGTNLIGLVKHLVGVEHVYLCESFGRPTPDVLPGGTSRLRGRNEDGSVWEGADMWATADESSDEILGLYRRACAASDATIDVLGIDAPGTVPHWPVETADTTLGHLLVRVLAETAQHAGHAEIVRELADGRTGSDTATSGTDWASHVARVQAAADHHAPQRLEQ